MPTTRPRHVITESDELARALDEAAKRWPEDRGHRSRLLTHLLREGHRAVTAQHEHTTRSRRETVTATSGILTGVYEPNYLGALREDWPA